MANISVSVDNSNILTITNTNTNNIEYTFERLTCKGNNFSFSPFYSSGATIGTAILLDSENDTIILTEDNLYRLTTSELGVTEVYYVRATANIEACERAFIKEIECYSEDCDKYIYYQRVMRNMSFFSTKHALFSMLNSYQQLQSLPSVLISLSSAELLTICNRFCLLRDICGCYVDQSYNKSLPDCGCK